jgi:hypothetical protein
MTKIENGTKVQFFSHRNHTTYVVRGRVVRAQWFICDGERILRYRVQAMRFRQVFRFGTETEAWSTRVSNYREDLILKPEDMTLI